jgi:hypothetical protein
MIHCQPIRFLTEKADGKEQSFIGKAMKEFAGQPVPSRTIPALRI